MCKSADKLKLTQSGTFLFSNLTYFIKLKSPNLTVVWLIGVTPLVCTPLFCWDHSSLFLSLHSSVGKCEVSQLSQSLTVKRSVVLAGPGPRPEQMSLVLGMMLLETFWGFYWEPSELEKRKNRAPGPQWVCGFTWIILGKFSSPICLYCVGFYVTISWIYDSTISVLLLKSVQYIIGQESSWDCRSASYEVIHSYNLITDSPDWEQVQRVHHSCLCSVRQGKGSTLHTLWP